MKYERPKDLNTPYPEPCEDCGAALTFRNVVVVRVPVLSEENNAVIGEEWIGLCKPCADALQEMVLADARTAGMKITHVNLSPEDVDTERTHEGSSRRDH